jgi:hypothetical protein
MDRPPLKTALKLTGMPEQLKLPHTFEGPPNPRPKPEKRKAVAVQRKPPQTEASVAHPARRQPAA